MNFGVITSHFDVAQLTIYMFWGFFAGLVFYLRKQDNKEGWKTNDPKEVPVAALKAHPADPFPDAPLVPEGNPLLAGVGAGAHPKRHHEPEVLFDDNTPRVMPMRLTEGFSVAHEDQDPRGYAVISDDGKEVGTVTELWVDRSEHAVRYFEIEVTQAPSPRRVLVPQHYADIRRSQQCLRISALQADQFADIPATESDRIVTCDEEDTIVAYFAAGVRYGTRSRAEPIL